MCSRCASSFRQPLPVVAALNFSRFNDRWQVLAGAAGIEPARVGVKVPCLATWRRPYIWCGRRGSNSHGCGHERLKLACLPFPPRPREDCGRRGTTSNRCGCLTYAAIKRPHIQRKSRPEAVAPLRRFSHDTLYHTEISLFISFTPFYSLFISFTLRQVKKRGARRLSL